MSHSLVAKLNRTDTTLDLSQKAEKGMLETGDFATPNPTTEELQRAGPTLGDSLCPVTANLVAVRD